MYSRNLKSIVSLNASYLISIKKISEKFKNLSYHLKMIPLDNKEINYTELITQNEGSL